MTTAEKRTTCNLFNVLKLFMFVVILFKGLSILRSVVRKYHGIEYMTYKYHEISVNFKSLPDFIDRVSSNGNVSTQQRIRGHMPNEPDGKVPLSYKSGVNKPRSRNRSLTKITKDTFKGTLRSNTSKGSPGNLEGANSHSQDNVSTTKSSAYNDCPKYSDKLVGQRRPSLHIIDWTAQEQKWSELEDGGRWRPKHCRPRHRVAILVPFRRREEHLHIFINYMHEFLQSQDIEYGIYVIEQAGEALFNRGKLLNVGFTEALSEYPWQCVVLHDVDNLPLNDRNSYGCTTMPKHLSTATEKFQYRLPYATYFGGVASLKTKHYKKINGMSNAYWGWGAEDDDLYNRCTAVGLIPIFRSTVRVGRYISIQKYHKSAPFGVDRLMLLEKWKDRHFSDGLSNLKYDILKRQKRRLFTYLLVNIGRMA